MRGTHALLTSFGDEIWPLFGGRLGPAPQRGRTIVDPPVDGLWLEFVRPPKTLRETDLLSQEWVGRPPHCSLNVTRPPESPWWHPRFEFRQPVHAVRLELRALHEHGRLLWHIVFAGRPGDDFTVPNSAPPAGGKSPLFPEFCPPVPANALYELRVVNEAKHPEFTEVLYLRPKKSLHRREEVLPGVERPPPRPPTVTTKDAMGSVDGDGVPQDIDPEVGDLAVPAFHFL